MLVPAETGRGHGVAGVDTLERDAVDTFQAASLVVVDQNLGGCQDTATGMTRERLDDQSPPPSSSAPAVPLNPEHHDGLKDFRRGSAGTGLQMVVGDMDQDGDLEIVTPGKSGLDWFENSLQQITDVVL